MDKARRGLVNWFLLAVLLSCVIILGLSDKLTVAPKATVDDARRIDTEVSGARIREAEASSFAARSRRNVLDDILSRPLFSSSRRPRTTSSHTFPGKLVGMIEVDGAKTVLLLDQEKNVQILGQGEILDGWTVGEVENFQISMRREKAVEWVSLRKPRPHLVGDQGADVLMAEVFKKGPEWGSPEFEALSATAMMRLHQASEERRLAEEMEELAKEAERLQ